MMQHGYQKSQLRRPEHAGRLVDTGQFWSSSGYIVQNSRSVWRLFSSDKQMWQTQI